MNGCSSLLLIVIFIYFNCSITSTSIDNSNLLKKYVGSDSRKFKNERESSFQLEYDSSLDEERALDRLLQRISSEDGLTFFDQNNEMISLSDSLIIRLPKWPLGKESLELSRVHVDRKANKQKVVYVSPIRKRWLGLFGERSRLALLLSVCKKGGKLDVHIDLICARLSQRKSSDVIRTCQAYFHSKVSNELRLLQSRVSQQKHYDKLSSVDAVEKKKRNLDRLANPEKYQSKASTVRRPNNGGSRYSPGNRMRERQQQSRKRG